MDCTWKIKTMQSRDLSVFFLDGFFFLYAFLHLPTHTPRIQLTSEMGPQRGRSYSPRSGLAMPSQHHQQQQQQHPPLLYHQQQQRGRTRESGIEPHGHGRRHPHGHSLERHSLERHSIERMRDEAISSATAAAAAGANGEDYVREGGRRSPGSPR